MPRCSSCNTQKLISSFSYNQLKKKGKRRCQDCVRESLLNTPPTSIQSNTQKEVDIPISQPQLTKLERYQEYAIKNGIEYDNNESLIYQCNYHRNNFIAEKLYSNYIATTHPNPVAYSKCHKSCFICSGEMFYEANGDYTDNYKVVICECRASSWELIDSPDPATFDIEDTEASAITEGPDSDFVARIE